MQPFARLALIHRGPAVESLHHGVVAVADAEGQLVLTRGDADLVTFPRSSLKPFQAIALVETGAADALGLTPAHIALACASHHAQDFQVAMVRDWLARLDLDERALVCGPALPHGQADMAAVLRSGGGPSRVFHNCSGKHCGFLTLARRIGAPSTGYELADHPGQRLFVDAFSELLGRDAAALPRGVDGCGLPALALPVAAMARAAARFAGVRVAGAERQRAITRILGAMRDHADHISGRDQPTERLVRATGGRVVVKGGAEGFCLAFVPERGLGIAIKLADGASRAKMAVLVGVLAELGIVKREAAPALMAAVEAPIRDSNGHEAGRIQVTL
ncbi:asparaginase [Plastoroseomonas arctica]|uniref:Asparaginase n=1 Tax=Plastoroseomonas arctica TaxID=1509237 RepID=A0AAF1JWG2_9PROT|nr:asparaginase [Plastoroseomonas arctica]MBR0655300.1 asparaginase [Plastoroseomonas arctica]